LTARCGSCQQEIRWVTTENGRYMPLDPQPTKDGNVVKVASDAPNEALAHVLRKDEEPPVGTQRFTAHWVTCPNADKHRKRKAGKK
jgi:hypothetical protein